MKKFFKSIAVLLAAVSALTMSACTRIETGYVGLRVDATKQIQSTELQPGGFYQTFIGDVLEFAVKDIGVDVVDKHFTTSDNTALSDFDLLAVYSVNPTAVSELYTKKSRSFHEVDQHGNIILMKNYMTTIITNSAMKAVREYKALEVADKRSEIEKKIVEYANAELTNEKLNGALNLTVVQVKSIIPNQEILNAATAVIKAQAELARKNTEVEIAKKEAERMNALSNNSQNSITYMNAQTEQIKAQAMLKAAEKGSLMMVPFGSSPQVHVNK